jgi:hypothetical protein
LTLIHARGRRGRDRMLVGFITTYAISAYEYNHWCCEFESRCDKFVSDVRQVGGFLRVLRFPAPIKLPRYNWNIIESGVKHQNQPTNNLTMLPSSV